MRIAVLSDIHSNLAALDAVLAQAGTVDAIWQLGDVVGYGPEPDAVVERLAELGAVGVQGNHDAAALGGSEIEYFNPEARAAMDWTRARISGQTRTWLAALPLRLVTNDTTLVHGSPRDPTWEYVTSKAIARASLEAIDTTNAVHGHTHVPVAFVLDGEELTAETPADGESVPLGGGRRLFLNPGSVGQPRDGDPRASYCILDLAAATATWHRAAYDIGEVQLAMRAAGLPERLAARLRVGL